MNEIIVAVVIVASIGIITGLGLSVASSIFAVKKDEREEKIRECLPGANCGACGYSGCDGYAAALNKGEAKSAALCGPGGKDVADALSELLGMEKEEIVPMQAKVLCLGDCEKAKDKLEYKGVKSCKAASMMFGGHKNCQFGCIGYGDCVNKCPYGAISLEKGLAHVDGSKCRACKKCLEVCPKHIITMVPKAKKYATVLCKNENKGVDTHKECMVGCIGCGKCARNCEYGAITVENFLARVDVDKCTGCGKCAENCPIKCIKMS